MKKKHILWLLLLLLIVGAAIFMLTGQSHEPPPEPPPAESSTPAPPAPEVKPTEPPASPEPSAEGYFEVLQPSVLMWPVQDINAYAEPTESGEIVCVNPEGVSVLAERIGRGCYEGWYDVFGIVNGAEYNGYVQGEFLSTEPELPPFAEFFKDVNYERYATKDVDAYERPDTESMSLGKVKFNICVVCIREGFGEMEGWVEALGYIDGEKFDGYIRSEYLSETKTVVETPAPKPQVPPSAEPEDLYSYYSNLEWGPWELGSTGLSNPISEDTARTTEKNHTMEVGMSVLFTQKSWIIPSSSDGLLHASIGSVDIPLRGEVTAVENNLVTITYSFADTGEVVYEDTMIFAHRTAGTELTEGEYYYMNTSNGPEKVNAATDLPLNSTAWTQTEAQFGYHKNEDGTLTYSGMHRFRVIPAFSSGMPSIPEYVPERCIEDRAYDEFYGRNGD